MVGRFFAAGGPCGIAYGSRRPGHGPAAGPCSSGQSGPGFGFLGSAGLWVAAQGLDQGIRSGPLL